MEWEIYVTFLCVYALIYGGLEMIKHYYGYTYCQFSKYQDSSDTHCSQRIQAEKYRKRHLIIAGIQLTLIILFPAAFMFLIYYIQQT